MVLIIRSDVLLYKFLIVFMKEQKEYCRFWLFFSILNRKNLLEGGNAFNNSSCRIKVVIVVYEGAIVRRLSNLGQGGGRRL